MLRIISYNVIKTDIISIGHKYPWFQVSEKKCYCSVAKANQKNTLHYADLSKTYKHPKQTVMQNLHDFYGIDFQASEKQLKRFDVIKFLPLAKLTNNCLFLKKENVTADRILMNVRVLSFSNLSEKVELLKHLPYSVNDLFPLLNVRMSVLRRLVTEDLDHRIELISKLLEAPIIEVCKFLSKSAFNEMDLQTFERRFNLLRSYGMSVTAINRDCNVFKMDVNLLTQRLDKLQKHGIKKFDSLMLCKPEDTFLKQFRVLQITGGDTTREYLTKKLKLTPEQLNSFTIRAPSIYRKNVEAIEVLINNLFLRGFTTEHIIMCPTILVTSLAKVERRLNELNNLEQRKKELYRVVANEKLYKRYFSKI